MKLITKEKSQLNKRLQQRLVYDFNKRKKYSTLTNRVTDFYDITQKIMYNNRFIRFKKQ